VLSLSLSEEKHPKIANWLAGGLNVPLYYIVWKKNYLKKTSKKSPWKSPKRPLKLYPKQSKTPPKIQISPPPEPLKIPRNST